MNNTTDMKQELQFTQEQGRKIAREYPDFVKGLVGFDKTGMAEGALSKKTKELIAISLSVVKQCSYCIAWGLPIMKVHQTMRSWRPHLLPACWGEDQRGCIPNSFTKRLKAFQTWRNRQ